MKRYYLIDNKSWYLLFIIYFEVWKNILSSYILIRFGDEIYIKNFIILFFISLKYFLNFKVDFSHNYMSLSMYFENLLRYYLQF
jgi:hypothetical protein